MDGNVLQSQVDERRADATLMRPVGESERIGELDVLRGIALFGVLTMNFVAFSAPGMGLTAAQAAALPTAALDEVAFAAVRWLVGDKANTIFATLFGLGFYLQLQRGAGDAGFESRYRRRLGWLLVFGVLNTAFLWVWDILNLYALAGFLLLALRNWSTRALVWFGLLAGIYSDKLQEWLVGALGLPLASSAAFYSDEGIVERQTVMRSADYGDVVAYFANFTAVDWVLSGLVVAWLVYALGRFALGAAIGRSGILGDLPRFLPLLRRVAWIALPAGLVISLVITLIRLKHWAPLGDDASLVTLANILRAPTSLVLAAGYCAAIVVAYQTAVGRQLFGVFAPVGRMALTNYLAQGLIYGLVLFGVGPGLALIGHIGTLYVVLICIGFFTFQILFSHWWLRHFRFGPMEWLWRALTYREWPRMQRTMPAAG